MDAIEYIVKPNERWDLVAYRCYGTVDNILLSDGTAVNAISHIIRNNPDIPVKAIIDDGTVLQIPIIDNNNSKIDNSLLPPWKRS